MELREWKSQENGERYVVGSFGFGETSGVAANGPAFTNYILRR